MDSHGKFLWNELMTLDVEAAKTFYARVAGWTYQEMPSGEGTYTLAFVPGETTPVAGIMKCPAGQPGSRDWFSYLGVRDINAAVKTVVDAGGKVHRQPFEIPNTGMIAIVEDVTGTAFGFLQPAPM